MPGRRLLPRAGLLAAASLALLAGTARDARAQFEMGACEFVAPSGQFQQNTVGASVIVRVQTPNLVCRDGVRIQSDSLRFYEASQYFEFFGDVRFRDPDRILEADRAQYFRRQSRLEAQGEARLTRRSDGTIVRGQNLSYLQESETRPESRLTVTGGRPTATLMVRPSPGPGPAEPPGRPAEADTGAAGPPDVASDTAGVLPPDTAGVLPPDTVVAPPPDTVAVPDTAGLAVPDTVGIPDTAGLPVPDTAAGADTAAAPPPDTLPPPGPPAADTAEARREDADRAPGAAMAGPRAPVGDPVPYDVEADRIEITGESGFRATGRVVITRDSLEAFAEEAVYDQGPGTLLLTGDARMVDVGYTLEGEAIEAVLPGESIREIEARRRAVLSGEDLDLRAPTIRLFLDDGALQRLVAVHDSAAVAGREDDLGGAPLPSAEGMDLFELDHPPRPVARAQDMRLVADSVEVILPDEVLDRLLAVGGARAENLSRDSLNTADTPEVVRHDWIEGDRVEAVFEPVSAPVATPSDTTGGRDYRMERLVARGSARSLYRMTPQDTAGWGDGTDRRLAVHFVRGDTITLELQAGEVRTMEVVGQVEGVHWEPTARSGGGVARPSPVAGAPTERDARRAAPGKEIP